MTADYVIAGLLRRSVSYLRINSEELNNSNTELDPVARLLSYEVGGQYHLVTPHKLQSVFFRRPVYLRDYGFDDRPEDERFSAWQWAAFLRNLMIFDEARWINDPVATYRAEHKALQLHLAKRSGFVVPRTLITNRPRPASFGHANSTVAVKGLDTVLVRGPDHESFGFTTFQSTEKLELDDWQSAPATVQTALSDKVDIRVTVVDGRVFSVRITVNGRPVSDDWRTYRQGVRYEKCELPDGVQTRCRAIMQSLGLVIGGIDLALVDGEYYFLEINPTGEWAWLVDSAELPIDEAVVDALLRVGDDGVDQTGADN